MYQFKVDHIPFSKKKRSGIKTEKKYFCVHNTSNSKSSAANERAWLENPSNKRTASWNYCIDDKEIIEAIPPEEMAFHAQNGGSRESIGVEICEINWSNTRANAINFLAKELLRKGWGVDRLKRHDDYYKKGCPRIINKEGWDKFKTDVKAKMAEISQPQPSRSDSTPKLTRLLKLGCSGNDVRTLQTLLNAKNNASLKIDGIFGKKTLAAVRNFQYVNKLVVDGLVGKNTWAKLVG